jgi:hypothetical protein
MMIELEMFEHIPRTVNDLLTPNAYRFGWNGVAASSFASLLAPV